MLILFLYFDFVSSQTVGNEKEALKDQLVRSISHVSELLVYVENKIGRERELLSQIDNELNEPREPEPDVDYGINIFWNGSSTLSDGSGKYGNYTYTVQTTPSLFPTPSPTSTYGTPPVNWHLSTPAEGTITTDTLYIQDLKKNMATKHYGYFSAFVDEFTELLFTKNMSDSYTVATLLSLLIKKGVNEGKFESMGDNLLNGLGMLLFWFDALTPARIQQQAGVLHHIIQVKDKALSSDMNNLINYYDNMFTKEDGQKLFEALELFFIYPAANVSLATVGETIFLAVLTPYHRSEGTRKQKRLFQLLLMAAHDIDPHFRVQYEANEYAKDRYQAYIPKRRSMNYKKIVKHLLLKHRKLFKKLKRQYKHDKLKKHHHYSHKQKRHHSYGKHHDRLHRHGLHKREQIKQRADIESNDNQQNDETEENSNKRNAYYDENFETHKQENIHKQKRSQRELEPEPRQRKIYKRTKTSALSMAQTPDKDQARPQYLKRVTNKFLRKRQQNQNFNRNRRFNILSGEDIYSHSQDNQNSIENEKLNKIRESSSYSDEENHLRMNLYDALRHDNKTFVSLRKSNGDDTVIKQTLRDLSSQADEEWVFKKNIYKVFE